MRRPWKRTFFQSLRQRRRDLLQRAVAEVAFSREIGQSKRKAQFVLVRGQLPDFNSEIPGDLGAHVIGKRPEAMDLLRDRFLVGAPDDFLLLREGL